LFFRNVTSYENGNVGGVFRALPSIYTTAFEAEVRQPLARGRGTQVNRVPVVLARIRDDISLADFESSVRNAVMDVESAYWDLQLRYRELEAAKIGRDSALGTWRIVYAKTPQFETRQAEAQAREQYFFFRSASETALRELYTAENNLRWLMGLAATDGRLIRPIDQPTTARVEFNWDEIHCEALIRVPEVRRQKWVIQQREMELIAARNQLLPQVNLVALYRWLGLGDELIGAERNGVNFPAVGSRAFDELTEGNYQELSFGVELQMPVGFRRELAGVRQAQLLLAREKAVLEDLELNASHLLATSVRNADSYYQLAQTHFNRLAASEQEITSVESLYEGGRATLDLLLDAQRRRAEAQIAYFRALSEYNKAIAGIHLRKGSLLEYDNVYLAEGPWPKKAYWDALGHARRRSASQYMDYGSTRPRVISRGAVDQRSLHLDDVEGVPLEGPAELLPTPQPTPAKRGPDAPEANQNSKTGTDREPVYSVLTRPTAVASTSVFDSVPAATPLAEFNPFAEPADAEPRGKSPFDADSSPTPTARVGAKSGGAVARIGDNYMSPSSRTSPPESRDSATLRNRVAHADWQDSLELSTAAPKLDDDAPATTMRVSWQVPINHLRSPASGNSASAAATRTGSASLLPSAASAAQAHGAYEPVSHSTAAEADRSSAGWTGAKP
jgi:outer membrane protein TolC